MLPATGGGGGVVEEDVVVVVVVAATALVVVLLFADANGGPSSLPLGVACGCLSLCCF